MATVPDEQKKTESRILAAVLATPHADAVFETGTFIVPIPGGRRTSGYGDRREYDYSDGTKGYSVHLGVDIASPTGTPVPACGRGRVVFAEPRILTGNTVVIEHLPGLFSVYYHMSSIAVESRGHRGEGTGDRRGGDDGICHRSPPALGSGGMPGSPWTPTRWPGGLSLTKTRISSTLSMQ